MKDVQTKTLSLSHSHAVLPKWAIFESSWVTKFITKVTQMCGDAVGYLENSLLTKFFCGPLLKKLG